MKFLSLMAISGELTRENGCGLMAKCSNSLQYEEVKKMSLCRFYLQDVIPSFENGLCLCYGVGTHVQLVQFLTAPWQQTGCTADVAAPVGTS